MFKITGSRTDMSIPAAGLPHLLVYEYVAQEEPGTAAPRPAPALGAQCAVWHDRNHVTKNLLDLRFNGGASGRADGGRSRTAGAAWRPAGAPAFKSVSRLAPGSSARRGRMARSLPLRTLVAQGRPLRARFRKDLGGACGRAPLSRYRERHQPAVGRAARATAATCT